MLIRLQLVLVVVHSVDTGRIGDVKKIQDWANNATEFNMMGKNKTEEIQNAKSLSHLTTEMIPTGHNEEINSSNLTDLPQSYKGATELKVNVTPEYGPFIIEKETNDTKNTQILFPLITQIKATIQGEDSPCENEETLSAALKELKDCTKDEPHLYSCRGKCGNKTSSDRHCACDAYCLVNDDCCADITQFCPVEASTSRKIMDSVQERPINFKCTNAKYEVPVKMVTTCQGKRNTCDLNDLDLLEGYMPVFDNDIGLYYLNNYCARYNNFTEGNIQMPTRVMCGFTELDNINNIVQLRHATYQKACTLIFEQLGHQCWQYKTTCLPINNKIETLCKTGPVQMYVSILDRSILRTIVTGKFSFSFIMSINPSTKIKPTRQKPSFPCKNCHNEQCLVGYELQHEKCVLVYKPKSAIVSFAYIIPKAKSPGIDTGRDLICYFRSVISETLATKLVGKISYNLSKEYDAKNNSMTGFFLAKFIVKLPITSNLTLHEFHNGTVENILASTIKKNPNVFMFEILSMCVDLVNFLTCYDWLNGTILYQRNNRRDQNFEPESLKIMGLVTIICLTLSIVGMLIRIIFQAHVSIYHSFAGKIQCCFVSSLCVAHILFLFAPILTDLPTLCKAIGITIHFSFLVSFTWMAIIALDMYLTFRSTLKKPKGWKRLLLYLLISIFLPTIVISVTVALDNVSIVTSYKPMYGNSMSDTTFETSESASDVPTCLMSNPYAALVFFAGPLGVIIVFNTIMYILSLKKAWKQTEMVSNRNNSHFDIFIKLFIIMGFTWIFGFIGPFVHKALVYVFIVLNASQGVFIFISTVCTKAVLNEIKGKCIPISKCRCRSSQPMSTLNTNRAGKAHRHRHEARVYEAEAEAEARVIHEAEAEARLFEFHEAEAEAEAKV